MLNIGPIRKLAFAPVPPRLNRAHPLVNGMTSCFFPLFPGTAVDLFKPARVKSTGGTAAVGRFGQGVSNATTWTVGAVADTSDLNWTSGEFTAALWADTPATGVDIFCTVFDRSNYVSETNSQGWTLQLRATNDSFPGINFLIFANNDFTNYSFASSVAYVAGPQFWAGKSTGTTAKAIIVGGPAYGNSRLVKTLSSAGNILPISQTTTALSGSVFGPSAPPGRLYIACTWKRLLSDPEIQWFYQEPFGIFLNPEDLLIAEIGRAPLVAGFDMGSRGIISLQ